MRRGTNIRKRKRLLMQELNNKSFQFLLCLIAILIVCISIYFSFIQNHWIKHSLEKEELQFASLNETIPFSIKKIILFSSATASTNSVNQSLNMAISQFCDIGIYLDNADKENIIIQSLYIDNIFISKPELGTPCLYKKRIHDLGKCSYEKENVIENEFAFQVVDSTNSLNEDNYEIVNDGTSPICLGFYNENIKENFIMNRSEVHYNGTLLKTALIPQSSINCDVAFTLHIISTTGEHYIGNISFAVPFEDEDGSIYDTGYTTKTIQKTEIGKLIRIE